MKKLVIQSLLTFVIGSLVLGGMLCLLAGTLNYWQGWVFGVLFATLTTSQGIYLAILDPALLERRKNIAAEGQSTLQKTFIIVGLVSMLGLLAVAALDHRFGWSHMPIAVSIFGDALLVFSYFLYYLVFRQNTYAASSIKTFEGQKVISTGLYGIVRHPKYVGDLLMIMSIPLALGSWWALLFVLLSIAGLAWRILDEEKELEKDLQGYTDYEQKVRYRLVPYLW